MRTRYLVIVATLASGLLTAGCRAKPSLPEGVQSIQRPALDQLDAGSQDKITALTDILLGFERGTRDIPVPEKLAAIYAAAGNTFQAYGITEQAMPSCSNRLKMPAGTTSSVRY